jgi:Ca-activated chloride channel family protein
MGQAEGGFPMTRMRWFGLLVGFLCPLSAFADGFIIVRPAVDIVFIPSPHPQPRYAFAPLAVSYHQVDVRIEGQVAVTSVDQEFVNPSSQRLEGTYIFPLPKGGQIDRFSMFIDGKEQEAELLPAEKARAIYEDIVRQARDPALLEYVGRDLFKVRIFPIEPNSRKRVKLSYRQVLKADGTLVEYVYPLNTERFSSQPVERVSIKVELTGESQIRNVYSPSHKVEVTRHDGKRVVVGYEEKGTRPDTDFHLCFSRDPKALGMSLLTYRPDPKQDGTFLLLASPGPALEAEELGEKDVVFVLDTSGSMAGAKLEQAKKALRFCIDNLNDGDRFELIRFSTEADGLFGGLMPADKVHRKQAAGFVEGLKPMGGTAIDEALEKALAVRPDGGTRPFLVIFLTDGQPTIGETSEDAIVSRLEKANTAATRVFCFGIGTDLNTHLLDRITEATRSASEYVLPEEDIELKVSAFYTRIKSPVLTQVKLAWGPGVKASKVYPGVLQDLFRGDQLMVFGRYTGSGAVAVTVEGLLNGKPRTFVLEGSFPDESRDRPWVARLWAARRVGWLLDEIRLRGESAELKDEVTTLARDFGIVTPYTSYLILEDERDKLALHLLSPDMRVLSEMAEDKDAGDQARAWYGAFAKEKAGRGAVESRNDSEQLKSAWNAQQASAPRGLGKGSGGGNYAQQCRNVGAKTFYQNGNQWIDAEVQRHVSAKRVQVKFGTDAYFALCRQAPEAARWLSVGRNLQFALSGVVYEITE